MQVRTTGPGQKRDSENGIKKNGIRKKRDYEKRDSEKTGFGLQADRARPGKNWIISVCALQLQLQSYKRVYVCPEVADCVRPSRAPTSICIKKERKLEAPLLNVLFWGVVLNVQKNGKQSMGHGPIKVAPSKQNKAGEDLIGILKYASH